MLRMDELKKFINGLATDAERDQFADLCGTTMGHIRNVSNGWRKAAPALCAAVERATGGVVPCESLRPDLAWVRRPDRSWPGKRGRPMHDVSREAA